MDEVAECVRMNNLWVTSGQIFPLVVETLPHNLCLPIKWADELPVFYGRSSSRRSTCKLGLYHKIDDIYLLLLRMAECKHDYYRVLFLQDKTVKRNFYAFAIHKTEEDCINHMNYLYAVPRLLTRQDDSASRKLLNLYTTLVSKQPTHCLSGNHARNLEDLRKKEAESLAKKYGDIVVTQYATIKLLTCKGCAAQDQVTKLMGVDYVTQMALHGLHTCDVCYGYQKHPSKNGLYHKGGHVYVYVAGRRLHRQQQEYVKFVCLQDQQALNQFYVFWAGMEQRTPENDPYRQILNQVGNVWISFLDDGFYNAYKRPL